MKGERAFKVVTTLREFSCSYSDTSSQLLKKYHDGTRVTAHKATMGLFVFKTKRAARNFVGFSCGWKIKEVIAYNMRPLRRGKILSAGLLLGIVTLKDYKELLKALRAGQNFVDMDSPAGSWVCTHLDVIKDV